MMNTMISPDATAALAFLDGYTGTFAFLVDLKARTRVNRFLSDRQVQAVLNCKAAEARKAAAVQALPPTVPIQQIVVVPNGTYTVVLDPDTMGHGGDRVTLRVRDFKNGSAKVVKVRFGNEYVGFATADANGIRTWRSARGNFGPANLARFERAASALFTDKWPSYGYEYALESKCCFRCGRELTVPASIHRGLGPDCAAILGVA